MQRVLIEDQRVAWIQTWDRRRAYFGREFVVPIDVRCLQQRQLMHRLVRAADNLHGREIVAHRLQRHPDIKSLSAETRDGRRIRVDVPGDLSGDADMTAKPGP